MTTMKTALLIGDAVVSTGFSRMNRAYMDGLARAGWDGWLCWES